MKTHPLEALSRNLRLGLRRLRREPGFAAVAILLLALGIGANTTIFSVVNAVLFKPLPYDRPDDLVRIYVTEQETAMPEAVSYPEYLDLRGLEDIFEETAFHADPTFLTLERGAEVRTVVAEAYSSTLFSLLGLQPALGRAFAPAEEEPGAAAAVAMLGYGTWHSRFGADPAVVGSQILINSYPVTIVGVGPEAFKGTVLGIEAEVYLPWGTATQVDRLSAGEIHHRGERSLFMLARLRDGVSSARAQSALTAVAGRFEVDYPETNEDRILVLFPAKDVRSHPMLDRAFVPLSIFLLVIVVLVMAVAVSNLANLLLAKASSRRREMALRTALGARRRELVGQLLSESLLLAILGGGLGCLIAVYAPRWLASFRGPIPIPIDLETSLDWRVFSFAVIFSVGTGLLLGIAPGLSASRSALRAGIGGAPPSALGKRRFNTRDSLIVVQVAVSTLLLAGGGLFLRAMVSAQNTDPGFHTSGIAIASLDSTHAGYQDDAAGRRFWEQYLDRLEAAPGTRSAALTSRVPLGFQGNQRIGVSLAGTRSADGRPQREIDISVVSSNYWQTLGVPLLGGRAFRPSDDSSAPPVAVVSAAMARELWGDASPLGRRLDVAGQGLVEVVGIAADTKLRRLTEAPKPLLYLPFAQRFEPWMALAVRTGDAVAMKETLRQELEILNPKAPMLENKTMEEHLGLTLLPARVASSLLLATGLVALLLASCGLYGVIAFSIVQRTREVGIRAALGATRSRLVGMVVGGALRLVAVGLAAGLLLTVVAAQPLRSFLYGLSPLDPLTLATVCLILGTVTALASWLPARRAARVDIVAALKAD